MYNIYNDFQALTEYKFITMNWQEFITFTEENSVEDSIFAFNSFLQEILQKWGLPFVQHFVLYIETF
jgi:hypothetical protein